MQSCSQSAFLGSVQGEFAFGRVLGEGGSDFELCLGFALTVEFGEQITANAVQQVVLQQRAVISKAINK